MLRFLAMLVFIGFFFLLLPVAYKLDEVEYVWAKGNASVGYEGQMELSQFDIMHTEFRGLNFSRSRNGE